MFVARFVDRVVELERLRDFSFKGFYPVLFIYGPEGCGKTRLLRELVGELRESGEFFVVYVDALVFKGSVEEAVYGDELFIKVLGELVSLAEPLGKAVSVVIPYAVKKFCERFSIRGRRVVVVVDDVARPLGLEHIEVYSKQLLNLLEYLSSRAKSVFIVASTSEGFSRSILLRHSYVCVELLWNLPFEGFVELAGELGAPERLLEYLWRVTGGNPRALIEVKYCDWDVDKWFSRAVVRKLKVFLEEVELEERDALRNSLEDPDVFAENRSLLEKALRYNLVSPVDRPALGYTPEPDSELGIGENYAWQLPAYPIVLKKLLVC
ncbi:MAG TPA: AAA family ATPase [Thermoprotei archaeon]|nr:MAG: hypothetical protein DRJ63_08990 [Thermoprotei archaeon]HDI74987.1 AAA family ATPase [Thermoprotei archaeon]